MLPVSLRRWINIVGTTAAIATATIVPLGYGLVVYEQDANALALRARINATRLSRYIDTHGALRSLDPVLLVELIDLTDSKDAPIHQRVYGADNALIFDQGPGLAGPSLSRSEPIIVDGAAAGGSRSRSAHVRSSTGSFRLRLEARCWASLFYWLCAGFRCGFLIRHSRR
jgi:hypothetical protein